MAKNDYILNESKRLRKERKFYRVLRRSYTMAFAPIQDHYNETGNWDADLLDIKPIVEGMKELYTDTAKTFFLDTYRGLTKKAKKDLIGDIATMFQDRILEWLVVNGAEKIVSVTQTTKEGVRSIIQETIKQGFGQKKTADIIKSAFSQFSRIRANAIARTETVTASNIGSLDGARATGLQPRKFWIVSPTRARDTHKKAARDYSKENAIGLEEYFQVGSDRMKSPGSGSEAEENVNCRCSLGYVIDEDLI